MRQTGRESVSERERHGQKKHQEGARQREKAPREREGTKRVTGRESE